MAHSSFRWSFNGKVRQSSHRSCSVFVRRVGRFSRIARASRFRSSTTQGCEVYPLQAQVVAGSARTFPRRTWDMLYHHGFRRVATVPHACVLWVFYPRPQKGRCTTLVSRPRSVIPLRGGSSIRIAAPRRCLVATFGFCFKLFSQVQDLKFQFWFQVRLKNAPQECSSRSGSMMTPRSRREARRQLAGSGVVTRNRSRERFGTLRGGAYADIAFPERRSGFPSMADVGPPSYGDDVPVVTVEIAPVQATTVD